MRKKSSSGLKRKLLRKAKEKLEKSDETFKKYVESIKEKYPETTIVLIGSRAKGNHLPYSDYDLAVIFRKVKDKIRKTFELRKMKPKGISLDIIVLEEEELKDKTILEMIKQGKILHNKLGVFNNNL